MAQMHAKTRYNVRMALRRGVTTKQAPPTREQVGAFYDLLLDTAGRNAFAVHSVEYYLDFLEIFGDDAVLIFALVEETPVAGTIAARFGEEAVYMYGGSSTRLRAHGAAFYLQFEVMRWARECGSARYDMWGIPAHDPESSAADSGVKTSPAATATTGAASTSSKSVSAASRSATHRCSNAATARSSAPVARRFAPDVRVSTAFHRVRSPVAPAGPARSCRMPRMVGGNEAAPDDRHRLRLPAGPSRATLLAALRRPRSGRPPPSRPPRSRPGAGSPARRSEEQPVAISSNHFTANTTRRPCRPVAAEFFGHPSRQLGVIGVTGTDGKTTTTYFIDKLLETAGLKSGLIGTVDIKIGPDWLGNPSRQTTPEIAGYPGAAAADGRRRP